MKKVQHSPLGQRKKPIASWVQPPRLVPRWLTSSSSRSLIGYLGAITVSLVAVLATLLMVRIFPTFAYPGTLSILAILLIALLWGAGPSLFATLLEALLLDVVILPPQFAWTLHTVEHAIDIVSFLLIGFVISVVTSRRGRARAEAINAWQRLHDLFMQAPANIAIMRGPAHRFELANPPYLQTASRSDVLGKTAREVFPEAEQQQFMQLLDQVYATGVPFVGNEVWAQMRTPGTAVLKEGYFNFVCQPTRAPNGEVDGLLIHGVEVTEQVQARQRIEELVRQLEVEKEALQREERRTHKALDALLAMAQVLVQAPSQEGSSGEDAMCEVQQMAYRLAILTRQVLGCERIGIVKVALETGYLQPMAAVGYPPEEKQQWFTQVAQLRLNEYLSPDRVARLHAGEVILTSPASPAKQRLAGERTSSLLVAPLRASSQLLGLLLLDRNDSTPTYTPEECALAGAVAKLTALIIERERLLRERAEAQANELAAREATQRMDTFLGIASHELRTPLTVIKGNLQLARWNALQTTKQPGEHNNARAQMDPLPELLARAEQQVNRLSRLIHDLIEVSRTHTDTLEIRMEVCDLLAIVRETVEEQRAVAPTRTLDFNRGTSSSIPICADAERLRQVMTNYLTNALKYSPDNQPVEVWIEQGDQHVRVLVRDRGPGLTSVQQEQVWERFQRIEGMKVQSGSSVGLGLGLYISRMIIERHHGRVGVESVPGKGSTFWFALPYLRVEDEEERMSE